MIRQTANMLAKIAPMFNPSRTSLCFSFSSKVYDDWMSQPHRQMIFKSSNLRYNSKEMSLLTYFYHPAIQCSLLIPNISNTQYYSIKQSSVLTLNFLQESSEQFAQSAWESRKTYALSFRDIVRLAKIAPNSNTSETFTSTQSDGQTTYTKVLVVTDRPQNSQFLFQLRQKKNNDQVKWQSSLSISYEDHPTFLQSLQSNVPYITGLKYQLELSKEESLIHASNAISSMSRPTISPPLKPKKKKQSA